MRPIAVDLFAGAGGMSLGFEQAGFDVVAAVEIDPIHAATHKFNFPSTAVLAKSVSNVTAKEIRQATGIGSRKINAVFGGAPCQGFSLMGQRALDDPRNALVKDFVRLVAELEADYFIFENVKGLTVGRHKHFLEEIIDAVGRLGYSIQSPWRVLNAAHFGVPQNRERLILMGARGGIRLPSYPIPTTQPAAGSYDPLQPFGPSCFEAIGDLPDAERFPELEHSDSTRVFDEWGTPSAYAAVMRCSTRQAWYKGHPRIWDKALLTSSLQTSHTDISRRRFAETAPGAIEPISRFFKLHAHGISNTLRAGTNSARGAFTSSRPIHYLYPRCITVREMARLHGFPDWFRFHATKWHGARQVGNAVPPPLARAIANAVLEASATNIKATRTALALGDPALLKMDMAEAAAYWNEPVVIGRRNLKSGAKKRKQAEIESERLLAASEGPQPSSVPSSKKEPNSGKRVMRRAA